jgi:hypothetical protein
MKTKLAGTAALGGAVLVAAVGVLGVAVLDALTTEPVEEIPAVPSMAFAAESPERPSRGAVEVGATARGERGAVPAVQASFDEARGREMEGGEPASPSEDDLDVVAAGNATIVTAVGLDPFRSSRRAPATRYVLPGDRRPREVRAEAPEPAEPPEFRVVGVAAFGSEGAILLDTEGEGVRLVEVGELVMGYRLQAVDVEGATFAGPAGTVGVDVTAPAREGRRGRGGDDDDDRRNRQREERAREQAAAARLRAIRSLGGIGSLGGQALLNGGMSVGEAASTSASGFEAGIVRVLRTGRGRGGG